MPRVLLYGLGPIGGLVARQLEQRKGFRIVGAVDVDPTKVGRTVREVAGLQTPIRAPLAIVRADPAAAIKESRPDVVVLCTSSSVKGVMGQIEAILKARVPIVTTTEELAYPVKRNAKLAKTIDARAKRAKVAVLATGVNPGFTMDALPIMLTAACERVDAITVSRVQDAGTRRLPFQQKIGTGLTPAQFAAEVARGRVRHVGLAESIAMIADAMGWTLDGVTDEIQPKIAKAAVKSDLLAVDAGSVCGLIQDGVGYRRGVPVIRLHLEAYLGAPSPHDTVTVEGSPNLTMTIPGGVPGDITTAAIVINSIARVMAAPPGLHTMRSLPLPSFSNGS